MCRDSRRLAQPITRMKRLNYPDSQGERGVEINLTNLVDCVVFLLIFFIVNTSFVQETGVQVQKPKAVSAEALDRASIMIALTSDGKIFYGGRPIAPNSVRGLIAQLLHEKDAPVVVLADEGSLSGKLVELIDECKIAGAKQVNVAARKEYRP